MRFYRLLMWAFPPEFRRLWADEMEDAFADLHDRTRHQGPVALGWLWVRTVADTLQTGLGERLSRRGYRVGRSRLRVPRRAVFAWISDAGQDLRYAVRTLKRSPGYVAAVLTTLALGIGANTALFSVAYGTLLKPLPFGEGERLVRVIQTEPLTGEAGGPANRVGFSVKDLEDYERLTPGLEEMAEYHLMSFTLIDDGGPHRVSAGVVSANYFSFLGLRALHGRVLRPGEDHLGAEPVIVLSHRYWRERFDADRAVVGRRIRMNDLTHEVVGVLPAGPQFPEEVDVYLPISACPIRSDPAFMDDRGDRMMYAYARVAPEVKLPDFGDSLDAPLARLAAEHPRDYRPEQGFGVAASPLRDEMVGQARPIVVSLVVVAGLVLIIAWANAASLALARANRRMRELGVRGVLGAGRGRLGRTLLAESVLLALAGGLLGLGLALGGHDLLVEFAARYTTRAQEIHLDRTVLLFALATSVLTGLVFGAAPGWLVGHRVRPSALEGWGGTPAATNRNAQRWLVAGQVAVAFAVVTAAGLALRTAWTLNRTQFGFETTSLVTFQIHLPYNRYQEDEDRGARRFVDRLQGALEDHPAVLGSATTMGVPFDPGHRHQDAFFLEAPDGRTASAVALWRVAGPGLFEMLEMEAIEGRTFEPMDSLGAPRVAIVNRLFRERFMPDMPLGTVLTPCHGADDCGPPLRVVGVVEDVRYDGPDSQIEAEVWEPSGQVPVGLGTFLVRVEGDPATLRSDIEAVVHGLDREVAVADYASLEDLRGRQLHPRRFFAALLVLLGLVAGGLALAGVAGVTSLAASARVRELGIRRALGARTGSLEALVLGEGAMVVVPGLAAGAGIATVAGALLSERLQGVAPGDPWTLGLTALAFLVVAGIASWLPARRASRVNVVQVLNAP